METAISPALAPTTSTTPPPLFFSSGELIIDPFTAELGSAISKPAPQTITESANRFNGAKIGNWRVNGDVISLQKGTFKGRPAVLLAFLFKYNPDPGATDLIVRSDIEISFHRGGLVAEHFPKSFISSHPVPTRVVVGSSRELSFGISPGALAQTVLPVEVGVSFGSENKMNFEKNCAVSVESWARPKKGNGDDDSVLWMIKENEALKDGIPREFKCGVVVGLSDSAGESSSDAELVVLVETTAQMSSGIGRFALLWTKKSPLKISLGETREYGPRPRTSKFDELGDEEWLEFLKIRGV